MARCIVVMVLLMMKVFASGVHLEGRAGYFHPWDEKINKIYGGGGSYGLNVSYPITQKVELWGDFNYIFLSGKSSPCRHTTELNLFPISLGLCFAVFKREYYQFYLAVAPTYTAVHQKNYAKHIDRTRTKGTPSGTSEIGARIYATRHVLFSVFTRYSLGVIDFSSSKKNVTGRSLQIGGFSIGGGVGYDF